METEGELEAPSGGAIETALAIFIVLAGAVLLPASAAAILATTGMAAWLLGVIAAVVFVAYVAIAVTVVIRKKGLKH